MEKRGAVIVGPVEGRREVLRRIIAAAGSLAVCDCGGSGLSDELDDARAMRSRFRSLVGGSYSCDYQNQYFLTGPIVEPVRMAVRDGQITSLVSQGTGAPVPQDLWANLLTVEQLFDEIESAARGEADEVRVRYDERYSYPAEVFIDVNARAVDEERRHLVSNLQPAS
jgi:hypothetical protein